MPHLPDQRHPRPGADRRLRRGRRRRPDARGGGRPGTALVHRVRRAPPRPARDLDRSARAARPRSAPARLPAHARAGGPRSGRPAGGAWLAAFAAPPPPARRVRWVRGSPRLGLAGLLLASPGRPTCHGAYGARPSRSRHRPPPQQATPCRPRPTPSSSGRGPPPPPTATSGGAALAAPEATPSPAACPAPAAPAVGEKDG